MEDKHLEQASDQKPGKNTFSGRTLPVICGLIAVVGATYLLGMTYNVFSQTIDEPSHMACGLEWLTYRTLTVENEHPPLARVAVAVLPYLAGVRLDHDEPSWKRGEAVSTGTRLLYSTGSYELWLAWVFCRSSGLLAF